MAVDNTNILDLVAGGLALAILCRGLLLLFLGVSAFGDKAK
jgi:hypothetical protein